MEQDHYKVLGLSRSASKGEIKEAFRRLALQFHPDKHAHSPKHLRDNATLKFKQLSEAYDTLVDDARRADYNLRYRSAFRSASANNFYGYGASGYYNNNHYNSNRGAPNSSSNGFSYRYSSPRGGGEFSFNVDFSLRFLTSRSFLRNAVFAGILLGGAYLMDIGGETLWKMQNHGKSFEEAMETIEKAKTVNDKT